MPCFYSCSRCGYESTFICDLKRHRLRKRPCKPTVSNGPSTMITRDYTTTSSATLMNTSISNSNVVEEIKVLLQNVLQTTTTTTVNNNTLNFQPQIFCNFGHEDMSHVTQDKVRKQIIDNTPRDALQCIVNLLYSSSQPCDNETFIIDEDGNAYERSTVTVRGKSRIVFKPVSDSNALVETVCYKGVNIMDDAFNKNDVFKGRFFMRNSLEKSLGEERVDEYDEFLSDATNHLYSPVAINDPVLCALKDSIVEETRQRYIKANV